MIEQPPVPGEARGLGWDEFVRAFKDDRSTLEQAYARSLEVIAAELWRAWTRGMAVVPLPEPDKIDPTDGGTTLWHEAQVLAVEIRGRAIVALQTEDLSPAKARERAAVLLAAAARAEQLAADATGVTP